MTSTPPFLAGAFRVTIRQLLLGIVASIPLAAPASPVDFNLPAQPADRALMSFCRQAKAELLFSFDELHQVRSSPVSGPHEPEEALRMILEGTGFAATQKGAGRFVVTPVENKGSIKGRLLAADGSGAKDLHVIITGKELSAATDPSGQFEFPSVPSGTYQLVAGGPGYQPLEIADVRVSAGHSLTLGALTMTIASDPAQLEPYVVQAKSAAYGPLDRIQGDPIPRTAIGNVDRPRSENDPLDYTIFTREQIARSGVIDVNDFLQREILDSDVTALPPERNGSARAFASGSDNLNMRGYGADATIVLVDGRRLPEIVTALPANLTSATPPQADVNVIPLSLIDHIEVLPVSASAIYSGSPVGGVINIVLRPDANSTELTTTYTNALAGFDAPQSTVSLLHGETLLGGKLHCRLNATFTLVSPPTETDLGYIRASLAQARVAQASLYRATPNVSSADQSPLFGPGSASVTSVAPGADGSGGIGAFAGRQGEQSLSLFEPFGGGLAQSTNSIDFPYGRKERSGTFFASLTYDVSPWLQLGMDASAGRTVNNTGFSVFNGNLVLPAASPFNPFHTDLDVTLNETAPAYGQDYDEAHIDHYSAVFGLLLRMRDDWKATLDAQYGLSITRYRGIEGVDDGRWQDLVDEGVYNPLRDTQAFAPPKQFYDEAVVFYGSPGSFVTLGDYDTFDSALRITNAFLRLPTGTSTVVLGGDYRYARLGTYDDILRYGDGSLVQAPEYWVGRSLQRVSAFGELDAPLLPARWLPGWIHGIETDVAGRYTASTLANESNFAPTGAVKIDFAGGFSLRGTFATSNRFPPPVFSRPKETGISTGGAGTVAAVTLPDPRRGNQDETFQVSDAVNPNLVSEASVTQTLGLLFERGKIQHFRASLEFVDTVTSGEQAYLAATGVLDLESIFPQRVIRAPAAPGDPYGVGPITEVLTGNFNLAWRHSYEWTSSFDYTWTRCFGGSLEAYCRLIYFQRYDVEVLPDSPPVDELREPDGSTSGLLKMRMNFGAGWSNHAYGFGIDGHYFHSRILPEQEWATQGSDKVLPYTQFDAYLQGDLGRWIPWKSARYGLRGQLRVDNIFDAAPPKYADDPSGAGVQPYGDWRGRIYSVSVTVTF